MSEVSEATSDYEELQQAVARAWTHSENSAKVIDAHLTEAIVEELLQVLYHKIDLAVTRAEQAEERVRLAERVIALSADPIDSPHLAEFDLVYGEWRRCVSSSDWSSESLWRG